MVTERMPSAGDDAALRRAGPDGGAVGAAVGERLVLASGAPSAEPRSLRIGIAGVHGHGRGHVDASLALDGAELAAVADPRGGGAVPTSVRVYADATEMIAAGGLDVVVLSTPIPTHAPLATAALAAGAHVLLEKPPVVSVAEHEQLLAAQRASSRTLQVGFQSLVSEGVAAARELIASGEIGTLVHLGAVGLWSRSEQYWTRARWSGHRVIDGQVVADGAATNPLAHALATALAIAGARDAAQVTAVELDMYRANDIDTDDTSSVRVRLASGRTIAAALSVTAPRRHEPFVLLRGTRGHARYYYTLDLLQVHRDGDPLPRTHEYRRIGLLQNLTAHIRSGDPLLVPLEATGAFTAVLEAIVASPPPTRIPPSAYDVIASGDETFRVVAGVEKWSARAAWEGRTFREVGAPWAT